MQVHSLQILQLESKVGPLEAIKVHACEWDGGSSEDSEHSNSVITGGKFSSAGGACTAGAAASEIGGAVEQRRVFGHGALNQTHVAHTSMAGGC